MPRADDATMDASLSGAPGTADGAEAPGASRIAPGIATLAPGDRFAGRYLVDAVLGQGGMGTVFRVKDELLGGELVALKVLDHATDGALERFRREVLLARRITSPHVARTHDLGSHGGVSYLTMELVVGRSLGAIVAERGALPPARVARIGAAVAQGLAAAHAAGVVHRDLKPDNVLVGDDGRVVVTDFGIARALFGGEAAARMTGGIVGTPHYMAPEQVAGGDVDPRADLFALGVLLFECLSGELPFPAETPLAAAVLRLQQPARELAALRPVPAELAALTMQLLERDRARRPASAAEAVERLERIAGSLGGESEGPVTAARDRPVPAGPGPVTRTPASTSGLRERVLSVMPFEHRGESADADVAAALRDELVDLLSRTRGLRPLARSASTSAAEARALGATEIVEASVTTGSGKLRASVRLLDVATGQQTWSERIEGDYTDRFVGPERAAQRIVEALRLALESAQAGSRVPSEALEQFLQARKRIRTLGFRDPAAIVALLDRAIDLAPAFAPALALHAIACVRAWFSPATAESRDWAPVVEASIGRALERAAHVAESHHAAGLVAWHEGRLRDAASAARTALAIAPTYPDAMAFLGQLETEAGREAEGLDRVRVAHELEPSLRIGIFEPARWHGLYGDLAEFERLMRVIETELREDAMAGQTWIRAGAWRDRRDWIERGMALLSRSTAPVAGPLLLYGKTALREPGAEFVMPDPSLFSRASPRFASVALQIVAEAAAIAGRDAQALAAITQAAESVLADLTWMERCPLFDRLRPQPDFQRALALVRTRVEDIWL